MIAPINVAPLVVSDAVVTFARIGVEGRLDTVGVHAAALCDFQSDLATVIGSSNLLPPPEKT